MKKSILIVLCLVFTMLGGVSGQTADGKGKGAYIEFDKSLDHSNGSIAFDYGKIEKMSDGVCVFKFKNTGKTPLILTDVKASCGCTVPTWPQNKPVMPGKTGEISVKYNTSKLGAFNKAITVTSNATNSTVELRIRGEVVEPMNDAMPVTQDNNQAPFRK